MAEALPSFAGAVGMARIAMDACCIINEAIQCAEMACWSAVARMEEALRKRFEEIDAELEQLRQRKQQIEAEIARLIQAIADGQGSKSITAAIGERERELRDITDKLLEPRPGSLRSTLEELRTFAVSRLTDIPS